MNPITRSYEGFLTNFSTTLQTSTMVGPLFQRARPFQGTEDFHKSTDRTAFIVESSRQHDRSARSVALRTSRYGQNESQQRTPEPESVEPGYFHAFFNDSGENSPESDPQVDHHGTENPRKSARRREQCRVNQARYRHRQHQKEKQFTECVRELREEIPLLELQRSRLICGVKLSVSDVVVEYFHLFRYGVSVGHFALNTKSSRRNIIQCPQTQQQLVFLRSSMAQDVDLGDRRGLEALMNTWRQFSSCFEDVYFQLENMEEVVKNLVVVSASLSLIVTEATLKFVFPELVGRELGEKLLGRRLKLPCSIWFQWDEAASLVTRLEASVDFLLPLSDALNSLADAAFVLSHARITRGGAIEEFDPRRKQSKKEVDHQYGTGPEFSRRKRSPASKRKQSQRKRTKAQEGNKSETQQTALTVETYRQMTWMRKPTNKRPQYSLNPHSALVQFPPQCNSTEQLAEWVFNVAKFRPLQLNLESCEHSEEVREALLRQFHRWPETKMVQTSEHYSALSQIANQECHEQVQLYLQDLRGKLMAGVNALFWLDLLQPLTHPASMPREEVQEVLIALLEELKNVEGLFDQLVKTNERFWAVLTLPLRLEPLFRGVSVLALCGHVASATEAMQLLAMFAEQYAAFPRNKKPTLPVGLSIVASVGTFSISDISGLSELPEPFRDQLAQPLALMVPDWIAGVDQVLNVLNESLTSQWSSCGRAPLEKEMELAMENTLQSAFERLNHALGTDQLYAMRKGPSTNQACLNINIVRDRKVLLAQLSR